MTFMFLLRYVRLRASGQRSQLPTLGHSQFRGPVAHQVRRSEWDLSGPALLVIQRLCLELASVTNSKCWSSATGWQRPALSCDSSKITRHALPHNNEAIEVNGFGYVVPNQVSASEIDSLSKLSLKDRAVEVGVVV